VDFACLKRVEYDVSNACRCGDESISARSAPETIEITGSPI
jgi:hypothetical protein